MADFRKWFVAFAVVALLSGLAVTANAQGIVTPFQCNASAAVTPNVRSQGLTELVGDVVLSCTGGQPTAAGSIVPQVNIQVFSPTGVSITSRLVASTSYGTFNEALLLMDEPHSAPVAVAADTLGNLRPAGGWPVLNCGASGAGDGGPQGPGICSILSNGIPSMTYDGAPNAYGTATCDGSTSPARPSAGSYGCGHPNIFQGRQSPGFTNSVVFQGVPLDPPGTTTSRTIRITNIRVNASSYGVVAGQFVGVSLNISISGPTPVTIANPQPIVAYVTNGLTSSVRFATTFIQCIDANKDIAGDPSKALNLFGQGGQQFSVRITEGFASAWKEKNIAIHNANSPGVFASYPVDNNQNVPGGIYNSESGFEYPGSPSTALTDPVPNPPTGAPVPTDTGSRLTDSTTRIDLAGYANAGTRLVIGFANVPAGVSLFVPVKIATKIGTSGTTSGIAVLTATNADGSGPFSPVTATDTADGIAPVSLFNQAGIAVYEILYADPTNVERLDVPVAVAFVANPGNNLPAPNVQSTATVGYAPFYSAASAGNASLTLPVPRFIPGTPAMNTFIVIKCSCNILFPWATNAQGYDTGFAIANTTVDPYGTTPQTGTVTINYYGSTSGGGAAPAAQTSQPVPGGNILLFTLSGGGNYGIDNRGAGFSGYVIAQAQFQFCHALALIIAQGATATAPGVSESYLGIVLDNYAGAGLNRVGTVGEVQAH